MAGERVLKPQDPSRSRAHPDFDDLSPAPGGVDLEAAAGPEPLEPAVRPSLRDRRQELDEAAVGLDEHLRDARRAAEVAVDLEGRMGVKEVLEGGLSKQGQQVRIGLFPVEQPGVEADDPGPAPAGLAAAVLEAPGDRPFGRLEELRRLGGDLAQRIKGQHVRHVAMAGLDLVEVLDPLLDVAEPPDLEGREPGLEGLEARREIGVDAEDPCGLDAVLEQGPGDLDIDRGCVGQRLRLARDRVEVGVLGRMGGRRDQPTLRRRDEEVGHELGRALHDRIGPLP